MVAYQTAWLKYYYPGGVHGGPHDLRHRQCPSKVSEYILTCRRMMGIRGSAPGYQRGREPGSPCPASAIRYGLSAIKSVGRPVVQAILTEREVNGNFLSHRGFCGPYGLQGGDRWTLENFIKAGAMDSLPGTRRQKMAVAPILLETKAKEKKNGFEGQMSLFDIAPEEEREEFQITFPDVGEYEKEEILAFEKEVLGVYISGHPLDDYEELWRKNITATAADFIVDEETEKARVQDGQRVVIGGMVAGRTVKTTDAASSWPLSPWEDLMGSVEVIVFPRDYGRPQGVLCGGRRPFSSADGSPSGTTRWGSLSAPR